MKIRLRPFIKLLVLAAAMVALIVGCSGTATPERIPAAQPASTRSADNTLTVYSRDRDVAEPLFKQFEQTTGIRIRARWGDPIKLAEQVIADGDNTPADVFYEPVSDALGALSAAGRLARLSDAQLSRVPEAYRSPDGTWVGTIGRAHVVFYNTDQLRQDDLPDSILGFADPAWRGRIGWDPTSRSVQDVVTAVRLLKGEDEARRWLVGMQANAPVAFAGADPIVKAVAAGQLVQVGFGSHYYLYNLQADGDATNVAAKFYVGDPGGLLNVAGVGIIKGTDKEAEANAFVDFMLSRTAQEAYARDAFEIPVALDVAPPNGMPTALELIVPGLDVRQFDRLDGARQLLTEVGILVGPGQNP